MPAGGIAAVSTDIGSIRCLFTQPVDASGQVSFVVRPENVQLQAVNGAIAEGSNTVDGHIKDRVFLGEIAEYTIALKGEQSLIARVHPSVGLNRGDSVRVVLPEQKVVAINA